MEECLLVINCPNAKKNGKDPKIEMHESLSIKPYVFKWKFKIDDIFFMQN